MRYKQITPVPASHNDSFTHTIYFGTSAYDQLAADIRLLPRTGRDNQLAYWPERWEAISVYTKEWLAKHVTARAIILHHDANGPINDSFQQKWNSLYLASKKYIGSNNNCKLMANDYFMCESDGPPPSCSADFIQDFVRNQDRIYLKLVVQNDALFRNTSLSTSPSIFVSSMIQTTPNPAFHQAAASGSGVAGVAASGPGG